MQMFCSRVRLASFRFFAPCLLLFTSLAQGATTVHWLTLSDGAWPDSIKKVITAFEAENPDIKVVIDTYPFRQLFETIEVRMKAQDSDLDMISVDVPLIASYSIRGYLAPLDEFFTPDEIKKTWIEASWKAGTYKGQFMAAPQNQSTQLMHINGRRFQRAGMPPPKTLG